ncbi:MAG: S8 family serine peptidase [Holophagales bacterium]|nr:S8 family serine peptidase [Holophagales bacterium]
MSHEGQAYVLMPRSGLRAGLKDPARPLLDALPTAGRRGEPTVGRLEVGDGISVEIVDSAARHGPRLVQLSERSLAEIQLRAPDLRVARLVEYRRAVALDRQPPGAGRSSQDGKWAVHVHGPDDAGLADVRIVAISREDRWRGEAVTGPDGTALLDPPSSSSTIAELYAQPLAGFWGAYGTELSARQAAVLHLTPVCPESMDALRFYYRTSTFDPGQGVKIGVIDDGVAEHEQVPVAGGVNTVVGEADLDFSNADREGHGTHVAGIVAASPQRSHGLQGVAPGAAVWSYRVFPRDGWFTSNYSIVKALMRAQVDGCDIVNLSLETSETTPDPVLVDAVEDAREHGVAVVTVTGNGGTSRVSQPGACPGAIAVAAFGREGTFPAGSTTARYVSPRRGADPAEFVAAFSNSGPEVTCIAPGVGIVSTLPGNAYGPRSGTSMAAPVVTGVLACLLSRSPRTLSLARSRDRARAMERLLAAAARPCGFGPSHEGLGRPVC